MTDFKEKIRELIIDEPNEDIDYANLTTIYNWPEISFYDEEEDTNYSENLDIENCSITKLTDDYMEITCGGDWQQPYLLRIEMVNGELAVTSCEVHEFLSGMDYDEVIDELDS